MAIKTKITLIFLLFFAVLYADDSAPKMQVIKAYGESNSDKKSTENRAKNENPTKDDYKACYEKDKNVFIKIAGVSAVVIDDHHALSFSRKKPSFYKLYDPFYNFYLIYSKEPLENVLMVDDRNLTKQSQLGVIHPEEINFGKFSHYGDNDLATITFSTKKGTLLVNPCCDMIGVGMGRREFLPNSYLEDLIKRDSPINGYIGVTFTQRNGRVYVKDVDMYLQTINFCPNDEIVSVNGEKITSKSQLQKIVLLAKKDESLDITIKRGGTFKEVKPIVIAKPDYKISNITYLEKLGLVFRQNLTISKVLNDSFAQKSGLKVGDKLLEINFKKVKTQTQARDATMFTKDNKFHLLFSREDFQFFVKFKRKDIKGGLVAIPYCPAI